MGKSMYNVNIFSYIFRVIMNILLGRQPVFGIDAKVFAYELFYREGTSNVFPAIDCCKATTRLIERNGLTAGVSHVTKDKKAMLNFCQESILNGLPLTLNPKNVIIEVLETVNPTDAVYKACCDLKERGYQIALDDFVYQASWERFLKIVDIVKVDVIATPLDTLDCTMKKLNEINKIRTGGRIKLLAEKIEDVTTYERAKEMSFDYYQGWLFSKTELLSYSYTEQLCASG